MKQPLVSQPSKLPTRKAGVAALIGPAAMEVWQSVMLDLYPPLSGPAASMLAGSLVAVAVAYWIKDRANVGEAKK